MRIFKNKVFARFAQSNGISDAALCEAIERAERGLIDADLGGGVIKQRVARPGKGRSGGFRTIILFRTKTRAFFVYGFAKNQQENIEKHHLKAFKLVAKTVFNQTEEEIQHLIREGQLIEVKYETKNI